MKWYRNAVEEQETEGSGFIYRGWIGFHIKMFPIRTFVDYKHPTPLILGRTVVNPNIDNNRCLQRYLILASEYGYEIIANHKMGDGSVYNKWWKQPDKYKVFEVSILDVEEAMDIRNNRVFKQSEEKFARLEELLKVSLNVFEITLLPGYDNNSKDRYEHFKSSQIYQPKGKGGSVSLCILNNVRGEEISQILLVHQGFDQFQTTYLSSE